jgi:hypothetical protein
MSDAHHIPPSVVEDLRERLAEGDRRMADMERQIAAMREELRDNSEITQDIREILTAAKVGLRVLGGLGQLVKWLGIVAGGVAAIYGAYQALRQGLPFPKG